MLCFFTSCYDVKKPDIPENLLTKEKMSHIILDLAIASAAKGVNKKLLEENSIMPEDFVFQKHQIDSITFAESNTYYSYNLKDFNLIYKKVKDSLLILKTVAQEQSYIKIDKSQEQKMKKKGLNPVLGH